MIEISIFLLLHKVCGRRSTATTRPAWETFYCRRNFTGLFFTVTVKLLNNKIRARVCGLKNQKTCRHPKRTVQLYCESPIIPLFTKQRFPGTCPFQTPIPPGTRTGCEHRAPPPRHRPPRPPRSPPPHAPGPPSMSGAPRRASTRASRARATNGPDVTILLLPAPPTSPGPLRPRAGRPPLRGGSPPCTERLASRDDALDAANPAPKFRLPTTPTDRAARPQGPLRSRALRRQPRHDVHTLGSQPRAIRQRPPRARPR